MPILDSDGLRPTTDRVRETLFNWLQFDVADAVVVDLFAGAGGLGLEAASRGAAEVLLIERDKRVATQLSENLNTLKATNARVLVADALALLQSPSSLPPHWDIVFVDPPFAQGLADQTLERLLNCPQVSTDTLIYLETEHDFSPSSATRWQVIKEKRHGAVQFCLLQKR